MLALTDTAVEAVRKVLDDVNDDNCGLRIAVETGGCSGFRYRLAIEDAVREGDEIFQFSGIKVFVDPESLPLLSGAEVDFVENVEGAGFVFNNPNAKSSCGCGKSFC